MTDFDELQTIDETRATSRRAWVIVIVLLVFSAYALRVTINRTAARTLSELITGEVTKRPGAYSKIRRDGGKQYLWAKGPKVPGDPESEWFDMTGSPLELEAVNHGIGRDCIPAINDPVFVKPDDPRFLRRWGKGDHADVSRLQVIGVELRGVAKAYPVALMSRHELVNDDFAGEPVTVGW